MELFLLRHADWEELYNCTGIDIDSVPLAERQHVAAGTVTLVLTAIYYPLYIVCMLSLSKQAHDSVCYRLLFYIGVADLVQLLMLGAVHGSLAIAGVPFCQCPYFAYAAGTLVMFSWYAESSANLLLALNRCLSLLVPKLANALFAGWRVFVWMSLCTVYALHALLFETPGLFTPQLFCWQFYPYWGYRSDSTELYTNVVNDYNDKVVSVCSPLCYLAFGVGLWMKSRGHAGSVPMSSAEKSALLQVFLISLFNFLSCSIGGGYLQQLVPIPFDVLLYLGEFSWLNVHGFPPIIYLTLNKTVRLDCLLLATRLKLFCRKAETKVHALPVQPLNQQQQHQQQPQVQQRRSLPIFAWK